MKECGVLALSFLLAGVPGAFAESDCAAPVKIEAPLDGPLQRLTRVEEDRVILQSCRPNGISEMGLPVFGNNPAKTKQSKRERVGPLTNSRLADSAKRLAIRALKVDGEALILIVDPQSLETRLEKAACWRCVDTNEAEQADTRFIRSVERLSQLLGRKRPLGAAWLDNAGLAHGEGGGTFLTGDLCPSHLPLDRAFLQSLERKGQAIPIALAVSGVWIERHGEDFAWLRREKAEGRLAIAFVNHSFHHPFRPGLPDSRNYLLEPGFDISKEILDVERILIANGETPSVFFRFPGLISDPALMEILRRDHLIPLGADAWLALSPRLRPGAIVLVHPNGNEPFGLNVFERLRGAGALPRPLRAIQEAP